MTMVRPARAGAETSRLSWDCLLLREARGVDALDVAECDALGDAGMGARPDGAQGDGNAAGAAQGAVIAPAQSRG